MCKSLVLGCAIGSEKYCEVCQYPLILTSPTECSDSCKAGQYYSEGQCIFCMSGCQRCDDPKACFECKVGYTLDQGICKKTTDRCLLPKYEASGLCVDKCPNRTYISRYSTCDQCKPICQTCLDPQICTSCIVPFILFNNRCIISCPAGFYT